MRGHPANGSLGQAAQILEDDGDSGGYWVLVCSGIDPRAAAIQRTVINLLLIQRNKWCVE